MSPIRCFYYSKQEEEEEDQSRAAQIEHIVTNQNVFKKN